MPVLCILTAVQWNGNEDLIPLSDLLYLEQQGHVVHIHLKGGDVRYVYKKLSDMAGQLTGQPFFQPHKSFLVHLVFVRDINTDLKCFVMSDGKNIPIRRELIGKARRAWGGLALRLYKGERLMETVFYTFCALESGGWPLP